MNADLAQPPLRKKQKLYTVRFEIPWPWKIIFAALAAAILLLFQTPALQRRFLDTLSPVLDPVLLRIRLHRFERITGIRGFSELPDNGFLVATGYRVYYLRPSSEIPTEYRIVYDYKTYKEHFEGKPPSISTASFPSENHFLLGTWRGRILQYRNGRWSSISLTQEKGRRVVGLALDGESIICAGYDGVFSIPFDGIVHRASEPRSAEGLARAPDGTFWCWNYRTLYRREGTGPDARWVPVWTLPSQAVAIESLAFSKNEIFVGTKKSGILRLDSRYRILGKELPGIWINAIAVESKTGTIAAGAWNRDGLFVKRGTRWKQYRPVLGLPLKDIFTLFIDDSGRLWIGPYGGSLMVIALEDLP